DSDADGDAHTNETVHWMVVEAGQYVLPNGARVEVGAVTTAAIRNAGGAATWQTVNFTAPFNVPPIVLNLIQTRNGTAIEESELFGTRMNGVATTNSFQVAMEDVQGDATARVTAETIGWMAIEPGAGVWNGKTFEVGLTPTLVDENGITINYTRQYAGVPGYLMQLSTYLGTDASQLRSRNPGSNSVDVLVREDTFGDTEIAHADERVGYIILEGSGDLEAFHGWGATNGAFTYDPNGAFNGLPPGTTATDTFVYVVTDGNGNFASNTVSLVVTGSMSLTILEDWRLANGFMADGSGPDEGDEDDFDGDGLINILEFAFGTDPNVSDNMSLTADIGGGTFTPGDIEIRYIVAPESLTGLFTRRVDHVAAGLIYTPEFSPDLMMWQT
ncbi:MAG: hypothetical protein AAF492_29190, partial [Verrucomicrobiota bacterium]